MGRQKQQPAQPKPKTGLTLSKIQPLTDNQKQTFEEYRRDQHLILHGTAGTGKTFISMYLALEQILHKGDFKRLIIVRSAVPTRDIGFLPGTLKEKTRTYELPYHAICGDLFGRDDAYDILKTKGVCDMITTSFIRGITLNDSIILVDECQNLSFHEADSIMTRVGRNSRIIFCGDYNQSDLEKKERGGLHQFMHILKRIDLFSMIEFNSADIVRSGIVKQYIIEKEKLV
jgi:phosphate starvation-inducible protein PhoH